MVNRASSYFSKGGHSATQTELKIMMVQRHRNSDPKKQATENHNKIIALERSVIMTFANDIYNQLIAVKQFLSSAAFEV